MAKFKLLEGKTRQAFCTQCYFKPLAFASAHYIQQNLISNLILATGLHRII